MTNKSLTFAFCLLVLTIQVVSAQTVSTTELKQQSPTKWRDKLKINYFGEALGSNLHRWDDNQYDQEGEKTSSPASLFNNFNIQYRALTNTSFLMAPRFFAQIGDRNELKPYEDQHNVVIDDWQIGVIQHFVKNKFARFDGRLTHRHPLSIASKNSQIDSQIEYQNDLLLFPMKNLTILSWNTYRYYAYEAGKNEDRYRINFTTIFNYDLSDKWRVQLFHELDLQHKAPKYGNRDKNKQDWNYFEKNKNQVAIGVGYSPTPRFTIIPFLKALNDENWSAETTQMGIWLLGKVF